MNAQPLCLFTNSSLEASLSLFESCSRLLDILFLGRKLLQVLLQLSLSHQKPAEGLMLPRLVILVPELVGQLYHPLPLPLFSRLLDVILQRAGPLGPVRHVVTSHLSLYFGSLAGSSGPGVVAGEGSSSARLLAVSLRQFWCTLLRRSWAALRMLATTVTLFLVLPSFTM